MNTESFHPHTCTYRIDTVVVSLYRYLGPFTGDAGDPFDGDQTVGDLRYLLFEQTFEEDG